MTKEKIIDGINVAECEFFEQKYRLNFCLAYETDECASFCQDHPNCYFKRLMHSREETEMYDRGLTNTLKALEEKTEELEILKVSYKTLKADNKNIVICYKNNLLTLNHEELVNNKLTNRCLKLLQALQEIKEFVENEMEPDVNTSIILQKCEVIDDNDNNSSI